MRYNTGRVDEGDLAWDMAAAESRNRHKVAAARMAGRTLTKIRGIEAELPRSWHHLETEYRAQQRLAAYDSIVKNNFRPVIDKGLFESFWGRGASKVWLSLQKKVGREPQIPLEFVHVVNDEYVLTGNLQAAIPKLRPASSGEILQRIVDYLGTDKGAELLESQGLPIDLFRNSESSIE